MDNNYDKYMRNLTNVNKWNNESDEYKQEELETMVSDELKLYLKKLVKESINEMMEKENKDDYTREDKAKYDLSHAIIKEDPKSKYDVNFQMIKENKKEYNPKYISKNSVNGNVYYCDDDSLDDVACLPKPLRDKYYKLQNEQFIADIQNMQKEQDIQNELSDNYKLQNISDCGIIGNRIKDILSATGRTATWLSKVTEIPKSTISSIIYGTNSVSLENAFKISLAFKMSIEIIFIFDIIQNTEK